MGERAVSLFDSPSREKSGRDFARIRTGNDGLPSRKFLSIFAKKMRRAGASQSEINDGYQQALALKRQGLSIKQIVERMGR